LRIRLNQAFLIKAIVIQAMKIRLHKLLRACGFTISIGLVAFCANTKGQGFLNLGFESKPTYAGVDPVFGTIPMYSIPGWTISSNNTPQSGVYSNDYILDFTTAAIFSSASSQVIDGNQSLFLAASSFEAPVGGSSSESISQTGKVPVTANSIQFKVAFIDGFGGTVDTSQPQNNFYVTMNNQIVPLQIMVNTGSYLILSGDVSAWAGQTSQLTIGVSVPYNNNLPQETLYSGVIDSIVFSPTAVPEPNAINLFVLGFSAFSCFRKKPDGLSQAK
jgi:hypothetical protein